MYEYLSRIYQKIWMYALVQMESYTMEFLAPFDCSKGRTTWIDESVWRKFVDLKEKKRCHKVDRNFISVNRINIKVYHSKLLNNIEEKPLSLKSLNFFRTKTSLKR